MYTLYIKREEKISGSRARKGEEMKATPLTLPYPHRRDPRPPSHGWWPPALPLVQPALTGGGANSPLILFFFCWVPLAPSSLLSNRRTEGLAPSASPSGGAPPFGKKKKKKAYG